MVHKYLYDNLDRVTGEQYNGTTAFSYYYGSDGALGRYVDHANNITANISYDLVGRVTDIGFNNKEKIHYAYNSKGNTSSYYYRSASGVLSSASYTYTDDGLPATTTLGNTAYPTFNYTYDPLNRLTKISHAVNGDRVDTEYSYVPGTNFNKTGLVAEITYRYDDYDFGPHDDYAYAYDNNGNITSVTDGTTQITYKYDGLNRLERENNQQLNKTITYTYDNGGNIKNKKYYAYTTAANPTNPTQTITYTYDTTTWKDKLLSYNGSTITYDAIGNPLSYRGKTLTWQRGRQLAAVNNGSATYTYKYDVNGQRIKKISGGTTTTYRYVSGLLVSQTNGTQNLYFRYDANGTPRAVKYNGTDYYYLYNLQGDVVTIYNSGGAAVVNYVYDSWGKLISTTGSLSATLGVYNPFRYRGYVYDTETGFYYLNSRYYDPETGRFINEDSQLTTDYLDGFNLFAYCGNNPVNRCDPSGKDWFHWAIGGAIVIGCAAATVITCGGFAAAACAVVSVAGGIGAATTASTIAAGAFLGSSIALGTCALTTALTSSSVNDFCEQGNWGTVAATAGGAVFGGVGAYFGTKSSNSTTSTTQPKVTATIKNDIIDLPRTGSALKTDPHHAFSSIVDNYAGYAIKSPVGNGTLYQLQGSLNGIAGRFEWIIQNHQVTHRMFVKEGGINGIPIMP